MRVLKIIDGTIVDGPGLRTSIYFAGCAHGCPGCHNPESWDFDGGTTMSADEIVAHVDEEGFNVTLTGGDPLYQIDQILPLCRQLHSRGKTIWCYTGYTYAQICESQSLRRILDVVDVIVDGPFVLALKDKSLRFRGSSNQRLIDVKASTADHIVLWHD